MINENERQWALITGASEGLGKAIAIEMAKRKFNLVLTSLKNTGLPEMCKSLKKSYCINVLCFEDDMTDPETPSRLMDFTTEKSIRMSVLVNNVGIGYNGMIGSYSRESVNRMLMLNIVAATILINTFVGDLISSKKGYILNIGSFAGFLPLPFKSIYSASKSYIYHLSMSLREELQPKGINVSVAMPGPLKTNPVVLKRILDQGAKARMTALDPDKAAIIIVNGMFRGKSVIVPGIPYSAAFRLTRIIPYGVIQYMTRNTFNGSD